MTHLHQRMLEDMQLKGSPKELRSFTCALPATRPHYNKSPDQITEEELRKYFLYIKNVKKWKRATVTSALCGIKFFYPHTLKKQWTTFDLVHPQRERRLPVVLTREEIQRISNVLRNWYKTHRNPTLDLPCSRKTGQTR